MITTLVVIVILVAALLGYAAARPGQFRYERSTSVKAQPDRIFPLINDFHRWTEWSPYENIDPALKRTYSGAPSGKGAVYEWVGNNKVGTGRMEITDAPAPSAVIIKLDFLKPFEGHNIARFTMNPQGGTTQVTWSMEGPSPFMAKLMGIFINMDRMIGTAFEQGLANLKAIAEK